VVLMENDKMLREMAAAFFRFVRANPDLPMSLTVQIDGMRIELRYQVGEELHPQPVMIRTRHVVRALHA
jgi:hypothetical protein